MPNNMGDQDKAYHRVPLEIWHEIFSHAYDHPELHVSSWDKHKDQPVLRETPGKWCPADPITFVSLANHDTLWPGSAHNFWQWLMPRTTWRIELPTYLDISSCLDSNPRFMMQEACRCVGYLERLQEIHGTRIKSIDGVFDATKFQQGDWSIETQRCRCNYGDYGDYFHKLRPATWFMAKAMKTFQGRLSRFRIVIEADEDDVMDTSKYCEWVTPNAAVPLLWQGSLGVDRARSLNKFPMVFLSMTDIMAEMQESGTEFKVILRGIDGERRSHVELINHPGYRSTDGYIHTARPWTSDQEVCDRDITDLWDGEAIEEARSIATMKDSAERRDRIRARVQTWGHDFECNDIGHILFVKTLGKHREARGEKYDYIVHDLAESGLAWYDSHEEDF